MEVQLTLGVEVGRGVDAAAVGGGKQRQAQRDDGGTGVDGGAEVRERRIADGRRSFGGE